MFLQVNKDMTKHIMYRRNYMSHYNEKKGDRVSEIEEGEKDVGLKANKQNQKEKNRKLIGRGSCIVNGNEGYNKI